MEYVSAEEAGREVGVGGGERVCRGSHSLSKHALSTYNATGAVLGTGIQHPVRLSHQEAVMGRQAHRQ